MCFGIVELFTPAALNGAGGKLQRDGSVYLYLHVNAVTGLKPMAQVDCNEFNKKMYRHGPGVSTGFCGLHHVMHKESEL
jgi:hypothetical protein